MFGKTRRGGAVLKWLARRHWALRWWSSCYNAARLVGRPGHRRRVRKSRRLLRKIRSFKLRPGAYPRALCYLRRVDPLVFEEVVLSALEGAGAFIVRNRRYSGDGGSDGEFWLPGVGWFVLQMKRYGTHVSREDVAQFVRKVERECGLAGGFFVHTGRTGAGSYGELRGSRSEMLSGTRLLELLMDGHLPNTSLSWSTTRWDRASTPPASAQEIEDGSASSRACADEVPRPSGRCDLDC